MTDQWVVRLPWRRPPLLANDKPHRMVANKINQQVKHDAFYSLKRDKVPALQAVLVELIWYPGRNGTFDSDGIAPTMKYCLDAMVLAKVLPDDNSERVIRSDCRVVIHKNDPHKALPASKIGRVFLSIKDASALAPVLDHFAP